MLVCQQRLTVVQDYECLCDMHCSFGVLLHEVVSGDRPFVRDIPQPLRHAC